MTSKGSTKFEAHRRWAWLLLTALASACSHQTEPQPHTAATVRAARPAPVAAVPAIPVPVEGEVDPEPRGAIGPLDNRLQAIAASDGVVALAVADAAAVRLFDSRTGEALGELPSPTPNVLGLRFSPDGKHLSAVSQKQNEVYVWEVAARAPPRIVRAATKIWGAMPLPAGDRVALSGEQGLLIIAATDTGQAIRTIPVGDKAIVYGLGLSKSGQWLSAVAGGHALMVVDLQRNDVVRVAAADATMQLSASEFSPDDQFVVARGSSFLPPKTVQVGAHPEGTSPAANPYARCSAMVATGLFGYAICAAIVGANAQPAGQAVPTPVRAGGDAGTASPSKAPTVDLAGMSAELMLWRLEDPQPVLAKSFGRTFEHLAWSRDSSRVTVVATSAQDGELVKRALTYQRNQLSPRSSALPPPVESLTLGRVGDLLMGVIASDQAALFMERREAARATVNVGKARRTFVHTIQRWTIPALQTAVARGAASPAN